MKNSLTPVLGPIGHYTYFEQVPPQNVEALLILFHVDNQAVGKVWVISHYTSRRFDAEWWYDKGLLGTV